MLAIFKSDAFKKMKAAEVIALCSRCVKWNANETFDYFREDGSRLTEQGRLLKGEMKTFETNLGIVANSLCAFPNMAPKAKKSGKKPEDGESTPVTPTGIEVSSQSRATHIGRAISAGIGVSMQMRLNALGMLLDELVQDADWEDVGNLLKSETAKSTSLPLTLQTMGFLPGSVEDATGYDQLLTAQLFLSFRLISIVCKENVRNKSQIDQLITCFQANSESPPAIKDHLGDFEAFFADIDACPPERRKTIIDTRQRIAKSTSQFWQHVSQTDLADTQAAVIDIVACQHVRDAECFAAFQALKTDIHEFDMASTSTNQIKLASFAQRFRKALVGAVQQSSKRFQAEHKELIDEATAFISTILENIVGVEFDSCDQTISKLLDELCRMSSADRTQPGYDAEAEWFQVQLE